MGELLIFFVGLFITGGLLIGLNLFIKSDKYLFVVTTLSCMLSGFIGFLNYSSLPTNYPNRKILALFFALTAILPCILNALKIKNNTIKPLVIKILTITILIANLTLMIFL